MGSEEDGCAKRRRAVVLHDRTCAQASCANRGKGGRRDIEHAHCATFALGQQRKSKLEEVCSNRYRGPMSAEYGAM